MIPHDIRCVMIVEKQDWKMLQGSHCCVIRNIENVAHDTCLYTKGVLIWHEKQWQKWGSTLQMAMNFAAHVMGSTWCNCWSSRRIVWPIATNSSTTTMKSIVVCICFLFHGKGIILLFAYQSWRKDLWVVFIKKFCTHSYYCQKDAYYGVGSHFNCIRVAYTLLRARYIYCLNAFPMLYLRTQTMLISA